MLHLAVKNDHFTMVKFLVENGISINAEDEGGNTALHFASLNGKKDIVKFLLENGANPAIENKKSQKPIDYSNIKGFNEITELLIKFGSAASEKKSEIVENKPNVATTSTIIDKKTALLDLKELLDAGILNKEKYENKKKKILSS